MRIEIDRVKIDVPYLHRRGKDDTFYFIMPVPKRRHCEVKERQVWRSLETSDPKRAFQGIQEHIRDYTLLFERDGPITSADLINPKTLESLESDLGITRVHHTEYLDMEVLESAALVKRNLDMIKQRAPDEAKTRQLRGLIWGATEVQTIKLSEAINKYVSMNQGKFENVPPNRQKETIGRWSNAIDNFRECMKSDLEVRRITCPQASEFSDWLMKQVNDGVWTMETARGKLTFVSMVVQDILDRCFDIQVNPFAKLQVGGKGKKKKKTGRTVLPLTEEQMLTVNKLTHKIPEIRALMDVTECTGAGITELVYLDANDIVLEGPYPHIKLRPNKYRGSLKNENRPRDLPLIGKALDAMKKYPTGFPRYRHARGEKNVSDTVRRLINKAGIKCSFNSFRHRFEDLLRWSGVPLDLRSSLMGHTKDLNPMDDHYGDGFEMRQKYNAIKKAIKFGAKRQKELEETMKQ